MDIDGSNSLDSTVSKHLETGCSRRYLLERLYVVPLILWLLFDPVPRFFQGDSISYLSTGIGSWLPPDRSWEFGLLVNLLLRHTHGLSAFILCQIGMLVMLVEGAKVFFPQTPVARSGWALAAILIAVDPLIEVYTRFYLSDFLAMVFFLVATAGVVLDLRADVLGWRRMGPLALIFIGTLGAVILRVAYLPIMLLTVAFAAILLWRHLTRRTVAALLFAACGSVIAVGVTVGANRVVFATEFPGQLFVNKLSGVFLAGVFAPALTQSDFQHAAIPITAQEFKNLDLSDYAKRNAQVWGDRHTDLQQLIKDNLHITDAYSRELNRAAWRLVISAVERDPWAFARIYLVDLADAAEPSA